MSVELAMLGWYEGLLFTRCRECGSKTVYDNGMRACTNCPRILSVDEIVDDVREWLLEGGPKESV